jgi:hypothetical protein
LDASSLSPLGEGEERRVIREEEGGRGGEKTRGEGGRVQDGEYEGEKGGRRGLWEGAEAEKQQGWSIFGWACCLDLGREIGFRGLVIGIGG